ncbi:AAA ATPase [Tolypothrix sp. NIES-4075]|nr:AAA ATPase [Tolypothrix sp. NIES-4075]
MSESQKFPESLLLQSPLIRLAFFDNYTMAHPRLEETFNLLKLLVSNSGESRVIFIYGPTVDYNRNCPTNGQRSKIARRKY